jgi:single-stranded DNA-specific DHH superfamily exonuclease
LRHAVSTGLLLKGGGHAMAAGVTISPDKLRAFRAYLEETLHVAVEATRLQGALLIDGAVVPHTPLISAKAGVQGPTYSLACAELGLRFRGDERK